MDKLLNQNNFQLIRNATIKLNYNGKTILVDPSLSPQNSFMSFVNPELNLNPTIDLPMSPEKVLADIDAVLLTHLHVDHFDDEAKQLLDKSIPIFGQPFDRNTLKESVFENTSIIDSSVEFADITIHRTGGKHGPDEALEILGEVSGFFLKAASLPSIYIIGDCLLDDEIKANMVKFAPDIIIVNSGGASYGEAKILMNEDDVVEIAKLNPKSKVIAVHMEALDHCNTTREMVLNKAKKENLTLLVPNDGETINF